MLRPTAAWKEFDRADERARLRDLTHSEALARYEALWRYARQIDPDFGRDWRTDVEADIELARVLRSLPGGG